MDFTTFAADIGQLVETFAKIGGVELSEIKKIWKEKSFSFIHEAKPAHVDPALFMQILYSCALGYVQADMHLSRRLGGFYMLYMLYETQLSKTPIKIYLSLVDLENIHALVKEAKIKGPLTAIRVLKRMMVGGFFLYGYVSADWKKIKEAIVKLSQKSTERVQLECRRLLADASAKSHFGGNLIRDLGLDELSLLNEEYSMAKQQMYAGGDQVTGNGTGSIFGELKKGAQSLIEQQNSFISIEYPNVREREFELELEDNDNADYELDAELERALEM